jgi:hypothetical protein
MRRSSPLAAERDSTLTPYRGAQDRHRSRAIRSLLFAQVGSSIPLPFLMFLIFWIAVIFVSFRSLCTTQPDRHRDAVRVCALGLGCDVPDPGTESTVQGSIRASRGATLGVREARTREFRFVEDALIESHHAAPALGARARARRAAGTFRARSSRRRVTSMCSSALLTRCRDASARRLPSRMFSCGSSRSAIQPPYGRCRTDAEVDGDASEQVAAEVARARPGRGGGRRLVRGPGGRCLVTASPGPAREPGCPRRTCTACTPCRNGPARTRCPAASAIRRRQPADIECPRRGTAPRSCRRRAAPGRWARSADWRSPSGGTSRPRRAVAREPVTTVRRGSART